MNIGLFTSVYFNNIGNGFIDLGAEECIKAALPANANFIKISQCANFAASMYKGMALRESAVLRWIWRNGVQRFAPQMHDRSYKMIQTKDVFSVANIAKLDYFIIPGCVLTVPFFTIYGRLLENKINEGAKIIFLGVSGNYYTDYEIQFVSAFLSKLKPHAILTRDSIAFKYYAKFSDNSYNGIDSAFFVNRLNLPKVTATISPFVVLNFDLPKNKVIERTLKKQLDNVIFTNHKPYPYSNIGKYVKQGIVISDYPLDYLFLYSNAEAVYSDRVHACITTLAFGNKVCLYSDSPRITLFENVGLKNMDRKLVSLYGLNELQNKQISYLASVFS